VVSLDNESYVPGSRALCSENLAFYDGEKLFARSVDDVAGRFDLVHVDADHSFTGALCDIAFAWALRPRVMLVDDFLFLEDVRRAAEAFAGHYGARLRVWNSYRGWAVFAAPDTMSSLPLNL
jgi:hypothetical protein